jgi:hypothetical protein
MDDGELEKEFLKNAGSKINLICEKNLRRREVSE